MWIYLISVSSFTHSLMAATSISFPHLPLLVPKTQVTAASFNPSSNNIIIPPLSTSHLYQKHSFSNPLFVSFNPSGNFDLSLNDDDQDENETKIAAASPSEGRMEVVIDNHLIRSLDLSTFHAATNIHQGEAKELLERKIGFTINYVREDLYDTRELSEYPDIRLWFVRLDAAYPWLPVVLDWRAGELARYASMLVPHQMSMKMGVVFNPEALELFVMNKVFIVYSWLKQNNVAKPRLKASDMARMLGFGIGDQLYDLIDSNSLPPS